MLFDLINLYYTFAVDYFMSLNTPHACRNIFTIVRLYSYHGRAKELVYSTYDDMRVDLDNEELISSWTRIKNFVVSETPNVPDTRNWQTDFFTVFGIFHVVGGGGPSISTPFGDANFIGISSHTIDKF
jgi:hypothetical protein